MKSEYPILFCLLLTGQFTFGQSIIDSCFSTPIPSTSFESTTDLANGSDSDLLEWTGTQWVGGWPEAHLTIPPPTNRIGCRAIFIGNGKTWTTGGEGFGLQLSATLVSGQAYAFDITSVSHGTGSDGMFSPQFFTNSSPSLNGAHFVGDLSPVGFSWMTNTFSFTATASQAGHSWIMINTGPTGSSGLIHNFCANCVVVYECSVHIGADTTLCQGETIVLSALIPDASYQWQNGSTNPFFVVTQPGVYWVNVIADSCIGSDTVHIDFNPVPLTQLGADTTLCDGETFLLDAMTPDGNYQWQDGSSNPTFDVTQPGVYWVNVISKNCFVTDTIDVNYTPVPLIQLGADTILCGEETLELDATSPSADYQWQDGSINSTFNVTQPGIHWVNVTVDNCSSADTIQISYTPLPAVHLGLDTLFCEGETFVLDATNPNATYLWQDNSTNATFEVVQQGIYWVIVENSCGMVSDTIVGETQDCNCYVYIPNVFSPNMDNINDTFSPVVSCMFSEYYFAIFNRWGEMVFETHDVAHAWDGNHNMKASPSGVYIYLLRYISRNEAELRKHGDVTLIR